MKTSTPENSAQNTHTVDNLRTDSVHGTSARSSQRSVPEHVASVIDNIGGRSLRLDQALRKEQDRSACLAKRIAELEARCNQLTDKLLQATSEARVDPLTGLRNRRAFSEDFERARALSCRSVVPLTIAILDLDYFKVVNDTYGHSFGDEVLRSFSQLVKLTARPTDEFYRLGGEEFVLLLQNTNANCAMAALDRIRDTIDSAPLAFRDGSSYQTRFSAGLAQLIPFDDELTIVDRADRALYQAKVLGRNRTCVAGCIDSVSFRSLPKKTSIISPAMRGVERCDLPS